MYWNVTAVEPQQHLVLKVKFQDGLEGLVKFKPSHLTGVFEALRDETYFKQVSIRYGAVTWPDELDLAPDAMHDEIKKHGEWVLE
jgi:hypothetical protein